MSRNAVVGPHKNTWLNKCDNQIASTKTIEVELGIAIGLCYWLKNWGGVTTRYTEGQRSTQLYICTIAPMVKDRETFRVCNDVVFITTGRKLRRTNGL